MSRIEAFLTHHGFPRAVRHLESSTRSVADAAQSLGCAEAQIGKTIVFRSVESNEAIVVVASGAGRIAEPRIALLVGESIIKADATFVKLETGYSIGGVPPFGHRKRLTTVLDSNLLKYETIYVAAGTPHSIVALTPDELSMFLSHAMQAPVT
jgi:prolyl-tRNA editing enzyme YbaK/EbsC (Cys-tRNA(Pro) deacylase)